MADLEVVLKMERLLLLTLFSHSHHCRSSPTTALSSGGHSVQHECKQGPREMTDPEMVLKKEPLLVLILSSHSHHCKNRPEQTHSTPTVFS
jgi:hypothetical protein